MSALKKVYSKEVYTSPRFDTVQIDVNLARITFKETGKGLMVKNKNGSVQGFSIAGADKKFHWPRLIL
ncbi:hypothetical protein MNBD_BACTEROID03-135 [hydrothermal vent metagenome]|uniref:Uncharacterized protein n=1 Tax=hydrothermal vent metagenome TaxID=652676 RepID=A0A3B0UDS2_9ZZZZ